MKLAYSRARSAVLSHLTLGALVLLAAACGPDAASTDLDQVGPAAIAPDWAGSNLVITTPLSESAATVQAGGKLSASVTFTNYGRSAAVLQVAGITSLPPNGTADNGPWKTFTPELGTTTVQPGATLQLNASASFTAADALGTWQLYATYLDSSNVWHDSPVIHFTVQTASSTGAVTGASSSTGGGAGPGTSTGASSTGRSPSSSAAGSSAGGGATTGASTTGGGTATGGGSNGQQSWVWVFQSWQTSLTSIATNRASFSHVSPTLYDINYDYVSGVPQFAFGNVDDFGGLTSTAICQQVHAAGLKCAPLIYGGANNSGTDQGIQNILANAGGAQTAFIQALVSEGKTKGYDGWNLDFEVASATSYAKYGTELISFLASLRQQLNQNGMSLSIDIINNMMKQSYCSGGGGLIDLTQIGGVVDSVIDEDYQAPLWLGSGAAPTSCPASLANPLSCQEDVVTDLELLCTYVRPLSVVNVGLLGPTQNAIGGAAFSAIDSFGFKAVSVWPNDNPFMDASNFAPAGSTWFSELQQFLAR